MLLNYKHEVQYYIMMNVVTFIWKHTCRNTYFKVNGIAK